MRACFLGRGIAISARCAGCASKDRQSRNRDVNWMSHDGFPLLSLVIWMIDDPLPTDRNRYTELHARFRGVTLPKPGARAPVLVVSNCSPWPIARLRGRKWIQQALDLAISCRSMASSCQMIVGGDLGMPPFMGQRTTQAVKVAEPTPNSCRRSPVPNVAGSSNVARSPHDAKRNAGTRQIKFRPGLPFANPRYALILRIARARRAE